MVTKHFPILILSHGLCECRIILTCCYCSQILWNRHIFEGQVIHPSIYYNFVLLAVENVTMKLTGLFADDKLDSSKIVPL
jgi:hypothetical protein